MAAFLFTLSAVVCGIFAYLSGAIFGDNEATALKSMVWGSLFLFLTILFAFLAGRFS